MIGWLKLPSRNSTNQWLIIKVKFDGPGELSSPTMIEMANNFEVLEIEQHTPEGIKLLNNVDLTTYKCENGISTGNFVPLEIKVGTTDLRWKERQSFSHLLPVHLLRHGKGYGETIKTIRASKVSFDIRMEAFRSKLNLPETLTFIQQPTDYSVIPFKVEDEDGEVGEGTWDSSPDRLDAVEMTNLSTGDEYEHIIDQQGIETLKYPDGPKSIFKKMVGDKLLLEYEETDRWTGKKDGVSETYYANGSLKCSENYCEGVKEGVSQEFFPDGKLKRIETWANGISITGRSFFPLSLILKRETKEFDRQTLEITKCRSDGTKYITYYITRPQTNQSKPILKNKIIYYGTRERYSTIPDKNDDLVQELLL